MVLSLHCFRCQHSTSVPDSGRAQNQGDSQQPGGGGVRQCHCPGGGRDTRGQPHCTQADTGDGRECNVHGYPIPRYTGHCQVLHLVLRCKPLPEEKLKPIPE